MKLLRFLGFALTLFVLVSATTPVWNVIGNALAVPPELGPAAAIVVLGGGMDGPQLGDSSLRRFVYGVELFKQGLAPLLVLSGPGEDDDDFQFSEANVRKGMAVRLGVPEDRIAAMANVSTTRDEAERTAQSIVRPGSVILLVTSSLHMRRAAGVFERQGLRVLPAPSDDWHRHADGPQGRIALFWEVLQQGGGLLYYRLFGYI